MVTKIITYYHFNESSCLNLYIGLFSLVLVEALHIYLYYLFLFFFVFGFIIFDVSLVVAATAVVGGQEEEEEEEHKWGRGPHFLHHC